MKKKKIKVIFTMDEQLTKDFEIHLKSNVLDKSELIELLISEYMKNKKMILSETWMEWFEEFIKELSKDESLIGNIGKPIVKNNLNKILKKYQTVKNNNSRDLTEIQKDINKNTENIEELKNIIEELKNKK